MNDEVDRLHRRLERERWARKEAEQLLEQKSLELHHANQTLLTSASNLVQEVERRTDALTRALQEAESANRQLNEVRHTLERQLFAIDQHTIVSVTDLDGNITFANQRFIDASGYSLAELIGANHRIVNSGTHPKALFEDMWQTISSGNVWKGELCNKSKEGRHYWVNTTIVPFLDELGYPTYYMSFRTDITPLKQAEATLNRTVFNLNERVKESTCLNKVTETLQNETLSDSALLAKVLSLIPNGWLMPAETHARILYQGDWIMTEGFQESAHRLYAPIADGQPDDRIEVFRVCGNELEPFLPEEKILLESIAAQIGLALARRQALSALRSARNAADAANLAKSEFLANMSHEIRTPMNGILGMTELALETTSDTQRQGYIKTVRDSAHSLLGIINDILDFSKIEVGKLVIEQIPFELVTTINDGLHLLQLQAEKKGLTFRMNLDANVPSHVIGDPTRLRQILLNLVGNAVKFTDSGGEVTVLARQQTLEGKQAAVHFSVTDSGIGIAADKLGTIFESFSQADSTTTRKYGGTGLGLTITRRLITLMGGSLSVKSTLGVGSTFEFTLPYLVAERPLERPVDTKPTEASGPMQILLVEDNKTNQMLAIHLLQKWGHEVTLSENGQQAVDRLIAGEHFDLILMDMQMPVMDGIAATRCIRALETERGLKRHPIVALTANAMQGDREICVAAGMDDYVSKPIRREELAAKLQLFTPLT